MKKSRFTEEQMVKILREADNRPVIDVAKQHGVSEQTIYSWRKRYGSLETADVRRLRELERENARLKKLGYPDGHMNVIAHGHRADALADSNGNLRWARICQRTVI